MARGQFQILFGVIALLIFAGSVVALAYYWERVFKPDRAAVIKLETDPKKKVIVETVDPGKKEFQYAVEAIKKDDFATASSHLEKIMRFYNDSGKFYEAKRILGEINVDLLFADATGPGKSEYTVRSGDALASIASRNNTTIDYIMRANQRSGTMIHPGDKLWVSPLSFTLKVNLKAKTLTVFRIDKPAGKEIGGETAASGGAAQIAAETFFKEYPLVEVNLPPTIKVPQDTSISNKQAWQDGKQIPFSDPRYYQSHKWLSTSRPGLLVQAAPLDPETATIERKTGILLNAWDMAELYTYIRTGTTLRLDE